ncbi:hypothetical protein [Mesobacterium pallidum]|uniref:hypothetical protein n=1 Tax=Mesobacterium pallidum TaxID=2872037 RepID=UPI001EE203AB|nr:hypothetical protein [Mesobacterium pallidum]
MMMDMVLGSLAARLDLDRHTERHGDPAEISLPDTAGISLGETPSRLFHQANRNLG